MPIPLLAGLQAGAGLIQGVAGFLQNRKATRELERMQSPTYTQNKSILDYYNKALSKYNVNPYQTDLYRMQQRQADRGLSSGLSALSGRGMALAGVNNLVQGRNDAMLRAGAAAEERQGVDLNRLGQASQLRAGEDQRAFEINEMQPFERKYNLKASKAGGGADIMNAGLSNIFGGLQTGAQMDMLDKAYRTEQPSYNYGDTINPDNVLRQLRLNQGRRVGSSPINRSVQIG